MDVGSDQILQKQAFRQFVDYDASPVVVASATVLELPRLRC